MFPTMRFEIRCRILVTLISVSPCNLSLSQHVKNPHTDTGTSSQPTPRISSDDTASQFHHTPLIRHHPPTFALHSPSPENTKHPKSDIMFSATRLTRSAVPALARSYAAAAANTAAAKPPVQLFGLDGTYASALVSG